MLLQPRPENWISFRNGYSLWGYSELDQINSENVGELRLVWSRAMREGYQEVEPLVYDGIMFLPNVEDIVQALDATTGDLLWEYSRNVPDNPWNLTGTRARYRNVALYDDKIFVATNDAYLVALDARTGEVVWETQRADYREQVAQTAGPIIVKGKVVTGSRCNPSSPRPGGCFITGHDAAGGEELWRINTAATPDQPGGDTWGGLPVSARRHASAWMVGSYDPELDLVYWGTGPPSPLPEKLRGSGKADLLYTNSTLALDPDTGELVWYFQHLPRDNWDYDHPYDRIIVETEVSPNPAEVPWINPDVRPGERRKVITGIPGKTGFIWTLDAATGQFLWARPTIYQNIMTGLEVDTGRPIIDESTAPHSVTESVLACPYLLGGKNQPSGGLQPGHRRAVHAAQQRLHGSMDVGGSGGAQRQLRHPHRDAARSRRRSGYRAGRAHRSGVGLDRRDALELQAARRHLRLAARHGRQPDLLGRHRAPLPRVRRRDRRRALADHPERPGQRPPHDLQRRRPPVRGDRRRRRHPGHPLPGDHPGAQHPQRQQHAVRLRAAGRVAGNFSDLPNCAVSFRLLLYIIFGVL